MIHTDVIKLFQENKNIFPHIRTDYLKRCIDSNRIITHYHDSKLIGILIWFEYKKRSTMKLDQILVDAEFRGKGISNILFLKFEELARLHNASKIILWVRAANDRAKAFYKKMGMHETDTCTWNEKGTLIDGVKFEKMSDKQITIF